MKMNVNDSQEYMSERKQTQNYILYNPIYYYILHNTSKTAQSNQ